MVNSKYCSSKLLLLPPLLFSSSSSSSRAEWLNPGYFNTFLTLSWSLVLLHMSVSLSVRIVYVCMCVCRQTGWRMEKGTAAKIGRLSPWAALCRLLLLCRQQQLGRRRQQQQGLKSYDDSFTGEDKARNGPVLINTWSHVGLWKNKHFRGEMTDSKTRFPGNVFFRSLSQNTLHNTSWAKKIRVFARVAFQPLLFLPNFLLGQQVHFTLEEETCLLALSFFVSFPPKYLCFLRLFVFI